MILHGIEYQRPTSLNMRIMTDHVTYSFLAFMKSILHFCLGCYCGGYSQNGRSNLSSCGLVTPHGDRFRSTLFQDCGSAPYVHVDLVRDWYLLCWSTGVTTVLSETDISLSWLLEIFICPSLILLQHLTVCSGAMFGRGMFSSGAVRYGNQVLQWRGTTFSHEESIATPLEGYTGKCRQFTKVFGFLCETVSKLSLRIQ